MPLLCNSRTVLWDFMGQGARESDFKIFLFLTILYSIVTWYSTFLKYNRSILINQNLYLAQRLKGIGFRTQKWIINSFVLSLRALGRVAQLKPLQGKNTSSRWRREEFYSPVFQSIHLQFSSLLYSVVPILIVTLWSHEYRNVGYVAILFVFQCPVLSVFLLVLNYWTWKVKLSAFPGTVRPSKF